MTTNQRTTWRDRLPVDLPDMLVLTGIALVIAGVARWSVPAAMVLAGTVCLILAFVLALSRRTHGRS